MFKRSTFVIAILLLVTSCGSAEKPTATETDTQKSEEQVSQKVDKVSNALAFINGYVANSNNMKTALNISDWTKANTLCTANFKTELKNIIDATFREDPEMGLDADPIFDAQDYPEKGFELASFDEKTNYLTVKGIDWPDFTLTLKVIEENGKWVVDGCGSVNIPEEKRAER